MSLARDHGVTDKAAACLEAAAADPDGTDKVFWDQALWTKLVRRGFLTEGRKGALLITTQGRFIAANHVSKPA